MKTALLVFLLFGLQFSFSQIPESRLSDWSNAGCHADSLQRQVVLFSEQGGLGDGTTTNDVVWESLITNFSGQAIELVFDSGVYLFHETLQIPSYWELKGKSTNATRLKFDLNGTGHCILIRGTRQTVNDSLTAVPNRGDSLLRGSFQELQTGDWILLSPKNDAGITSSWATGTTGQIVQVIEMDSNLLLLNNSLRRSYSASENLMLKKIVPTQQVEIERLTIERLDETSTQTANIWIENAVNCKVSCVESINCNYAHVTLQYASNIGIEGNYFHHGMDYGSGGKAYGVVAQMASGDNVIQDNIFEHLRHSMLLQAGANGNVFLGNYSFDPFWKEGFFPTNSAGDMVLHGNYPYTNLFEGNVVQNWVIDDSHGINGPHNVFFRNRAEKYGLVMNNNPPTDSVVMVGNEITHTGFLKGNWMIAGNGHFLHGNNVKGNCIPVNTQEFETSLVGHLFSSNLYSIGFPTGLGEVLNGVQSQFSAGQTTPCTETITHVHNSVNTEETDLIWKGKVLHNTSNKPIEVTLFNSVGKEIQKFIVSKNEPFQPQNLQIGIYLITWENGSIRIWWGSE